MQVTEETVGLATSGLQVEFQNFIWNNVLSAGCNLMLFFVDADHRRDLPRDSYAPGKVIFIKFLKNLKIL